MIAALAIFVSLVADGLIFAVVAEFLAASYSTDQHAVDASAFCIVALVGYGLPRVVEGFEIDSRKGYAITAAAGIALVYLLVRVTTLGDVAVWDLAWIGDFLSDAQQTTEAGGHALTGGILLMATWARATMKSGDEIEMETIPRQMAVPFAVVTTVVVLGALTDRSGEVGRAGAAFYVMAILSLAFSQLALSGATFGDVRAGGTAGLMLAATGAVAVVGLLVIGLLATVFGPIVGPIISKTTETVLTIVLTPFAWVLTKFFEFLFAGGNPFPDLQENVARTTRGASDPEATDRSTASQAGIFIVRTFALLLFLGVTALIATAFVRLRNRRRVRIEDGHTMSVAGNFREDIGAMFRSLFRRGDYKPAGYATTETTRLYLEVLAKAEGAGHGRPEGETAREFAPELHEAFATPVTDDITRAFEAARYGAREPDARTLSELRERWERDAR